MYISKNNPTSPSFNKSTCQSYFSQVSSEAGCKYVRVPAWVEKVCPPPPMDDSLVAFDLSAITPSCIKATLKNFSSSSAPGCDEITYHHLKKLHSIHHFLAALFSKILLLSHQPPPNWCMAKTILIHKKGDPSQPSNFRPITLSSCISKLFHKIIARRLEAYLVNNDIIDTSVQKGFLTGINGILEHILSINAMIQSAKERLQSLMISFLDLCNAFAVISHKLLMDMLILVQVPIEVRSYIRNLYSGLSTFTYTKEWSTPRMKVGREKFSMVTPYPLFYSSLLSTPLSNP